MYLGQGWLSWSAECGPNDCIHEVEGLSQGCNSHGGKCKSSKHWKFKKIQMGGKIDVFICQSLADGRNWEILNLFPSTRSGSGKDKCQSHSDGTRKSDFIESVPLTIWHGCQCMCLSFIFAMFQRQVFYLKIYNIKISKYKMSKSQSISSFRTFLLL